MVAKNVRSIEYTDDSIERYHEGKLVCKTSPIVDAVAGSTEWSKSGDTMDATFTTVPKKQGEIRLVGFGILSQFQKT